jgi:CDP-diacylglycerol--glycerol-3-phosphate 3-phosphatidyltransferase
VAFFADDFPGEVADEDFRADAVGDALFDEEAARDFPAELDALLAEAVLVPPDRPRPLALAASMLLAAATAAPALSATPGALSAAFLAMDGARSATASATRLTAFGPRAATFRATPGAVSATFFATAGAFSATFLATAGAFDAAAASACAARSLALLLMVHPSLSAGVCSKLVAGARPDVGPALSEGVRFPRMATSGSVGGSGRSHGEGPRVRDLPAPRRSQSAIGPLFRSVFKWPYRVGLAGLYRAGFRAWQLTVLSLLANVVIGWLLVTGRFLVAGFLLAVAGLLDIFDGGLARLRGEDSRAGAFLDSVVDRVSDLILFGSLFWALAGQGHRMAAAFALSSLIVSLLVSHIRAEGEALGLSLTEGFFQRLERYVMLMIGLIVPGALLPVLIILTALGGFTVIQRGASAWRQLD